MHSSCHALTFHHALPGPLSLQELLLAEQLLACRAPRAWVLAALEAIKAAGCAAGSGAALRALEPVLQLVMDIAASLKHSAQQHGSAAQLAMAEGAANALLADAVSDLPFSTFQQLLASSTSKVGTAVPRWEVLEPEVLQRLAALAQGYTAREVAARELAAAAMAAAAGDTAAESAAAADRSIRRAVVQKQLVVREVLQSHDMESLLILVRPPAHAAHS
jgi:hypothetical protein